MVKKVFKIKYMFGNNKIKSAYITEWDTVKLNEEMYKIIGLQSCLHRFNTPMWEKNKVPFPKANLFSVRNAQIKIKVINLLSYQFN